MSSAYQKKILITGGAGFIGSHVVKRFTRIYPHYHITNLDALTYAGNLGNLEEVENEPNYSLIKGDIADKNFVDALFEKENFDAVIHLAAESHVDRSILSPYDFVYTNVIGTINLLNAAKNTWKENTEGKLFYHISTDEVYGSLEETGYFTEQTPYSPNSPYSASKASSDHFVMAWHHTYHLPVVISNCSNNYGPYQFPEKLIPLILKNIREGKELPVYGEGKNIRDWLWVGDHAEAIDIIFHKGKTGNTYNVGGNNEVQNLILVKTICRLADRKMNQPEGTSEKKIVFVKDRAGHDLRYAIDATKLKNELGWIARTSLEEGLQKTIDWYWDNEDWLKSVTSGEYLSYYEKQYLQR